MRDHHNEHYKGNEHETRSWWSKYKPSKETPGISLVSSAVTNGMPNRQTESCQTTLVAPTQEAEGLSNFKTKLMENFEGQS